MTNRGNAANPDEPGSQHGPVSREPLRFITVPIHKLEAVEIDKDGNVNSGQISALEYFAEFGSEDPGAVEKDR